MIIQGRTSRPSPRGEGEPPGAFFNNSAKLKLIFRPAFKKCGLRAAAPPGARRGDPSPLRALGRPAAQGPRLLLNLLLNIMILNKHIINVESINLSIFNI